jgi:hypothetical protein
MYTEPHFHFDPGFFDLPEDVYIEGYWQTEKYFRDIADEIRREFRPRNPISGLDLRMSAEVERSESVSVHVRRGDYVSNARARRTHGTCTEEYYGGAMQEIARATEDPKFFVFSDDISWCRAHLKVGFSLTFVSHNGGEAVHRDLHLMSRCKHNIIANSSLGWWGAWLNSHSNKMVVAPKRWFAKGDINTIDLLPATWKTL